MKLSKIYELLDELAPKNISDEYCEKYGAYDNSGVLVETGEEIRGVLFSLDLSFAAIEKAKTAGANLIVTHHPAVYGKIGGVCVSDFQPLGEKLVECIKRGISVISMHLNLDGAAGGIDESFMQGIILSAGESVKGAKQERMHTVRQGSYGRAYNVAETTANALAEKMKKVFSTSRILVYGGTQKIARAASFCGAGGDEEAVAFAVKNGADVIISADFKHHVITLALEKGLAVIALTHYASEQYGFEKYYQKIRAKAGVPCVYHTDENLL